jgi:arylformamidase
MKTDWIWLSHVTSTETPAYGGGSAFEVTPDKRMCRGDSCNTVKINMSNHIGSHVDAPRHFIANAKTVSEYFASDWIFEKPLIIDIPVEGAQILQPDQVDARIEGKTEDADLVLLRTCADRDRLSAEYYKTQPGFSPDLCQYFTERFASFSAIGLDAISISSFMHRDIGRLAHKEFLGRGIRIFEDLALSNLPPTANLSKVIALPFRFQDADGSPVTMMANTFYN